MSGRVGRVSMGGELRALEDYKALSITEGKDIPGRRHSISRASEAEESRSVSSSAGCESLCGP